MHRRETVIGGASIVFDESAEGKRGAVVLLHGLGCSRAYFAAQVAALDADHRVVAIDFRGHGESDAGEPTVDSLVEDVAGVLDGLGVRDAAIVGHSLGGIVAIELARRRPDLASELAVLDAGIAIPAAAAPLFAEVMVALRGGEAAQSWAGFCARLVGPACAADVRERIVADAKRASPAALRSVWASLLGWDAALALRECQAPLLFVRAAIPFDEASARAASPRMRVVKLADTGHFVTLEAPARVNALLAEWLATPEASASQGRAPAGSQRA